MEGEVNDLSRASSAEIKLSRSHIRIFLDYLSSAIAQEVRHCLPTAEAHIQSRMISYEIRGGRRATE